MVSQSGIWGWQANARVTNVISARPSFQTQCDHNQWLWNVSKYLNILYKVVWLKGTERVGGNM